MSKLYEIQNEMIECFNKAVDPETGEIVNEELYARIEELEEERGSKIENVALWIKNLNSDAEALKAEKNAFAEREKAAKNKAQSLTDYLIYALNGEKFSTTKVNISYRKSEAVECEDIFKVNEDYLKYAEPSLDKSAVKKAIKDGIEVAGCRLVEKQNIQIK